MTYSNTKQSDDMKKTILAILLLFAATSVPAQKFLNEVYLNSRNEMNATFITTGKSYDKKTVEENAVLAIFHNIIYEGIPEVNDGKPLVTDNDEVNKRYVSSFFNSECKYKEYLTDNKIKTVSKPKKEDGIYKGTYSVEVQIERLLRDLKKNILPPPVAINPSIMVVPLKIRKHESYKTLLANDRTLRTAVTKIQEAFNRLDIETQNVSAVEDLLDNIDKYGVSTSNERELLRHADADVLVEFDLKVVEEKNGKKITVNLNAYETATLKYWASAVVSSRPKDINDIDALCAEALRENSLKEFLKEILEKFNKPASALIDITIDDDADITMYDTCENGESVEDNIRTVLDENLKSYEEKGVNEMSFYCDRATFSRADKKGKKMSASRLASTINKELRKLGIECKHFSEGNKIIITLLSIN